MSKKFHITIAKEAETAASKVRKSRESASVTLGMTQTQVNMPVSDVSGTDFDCMFVALSRML